MNVAIVGARDYPHLHLVRKFVRGLASDVTVVSGGAVGVDSAAASAAREANLNVIEHAVPSAEGREDFIAKAMARNKLIVNDADELWAFTHRGSGGTWSSIDLAISKNIPVHLVDGDGKTRTLWRKRFERDPQRIGRIMSRLEKLWLERPQMRFLQLLCCVNQEICDEDPFYTEDDEFERLMTKYEERQEHQHG